MELFGTAEVVGTLLGHMSDLQFLEHLAVGSFESRPFSRSGGEEGAVTLLVLVLSFIPLEDVVAMGFHHFLETTYPSPHAPFLAPLSVSIELHNRLYITPHLLQVVLLPRIVMQPLEVNQLL